MMNVNVRETMPSSSFATESAWAVLKQERGIGSLMDFMEPEDERAAAQYAKGLSPEEQQIMQRMSESFKQLPPDLQSRLTASAHRMMQEHRGNLSQVLDMPSQEQEGPVAKFFPIVIGAIFAIDALNSSLGAKRSLVGNVFTDMGNGIASLAGGGSNYFGESNYRDMFEYDGGGMGKTASFVDPFTGKKWGTIEDPSIFESAGLGLLSAGASAVNPVRVLSAGAKGLATVTGRAGAAVGRGLGRTQQAIGRGISRLGSRGTTRAGNKAVGKLGEVEDMGASFGARAAEDAARAADEAARNSAVGLTDRFGRYTQRSGQSRIDLANASQAGKVARFKQSMRPNTLAGGPGWKTYRGITGAAHSPGIREKFGNALALGAYGGGQYLSEDFLEDPMEFGDSGTGGTLGTGGLGGDGEASGWGMGNRAIYDPSQDLDFSKEREFTTGYGEIKMSENMKIGERMLKEAKDAMYAQDMAKDKPCPECGEKVTKMGCMKMGCGSMSKADKKPAHGMVIVIGSKAGPGPSKDGKREKVDSDKKD